MSVMSRSRIASALRLFAHAVAAAGSVETGHTPSKRHLDGLGIDPAAFRKIGRG